MRTCAPVAAAALALAGCGSAAIHDLPPAAEPRTSPPLRAAPAGRLVRVGPPIVALTADRRGAAGGAPEGLAVDPRTGIVAVGLRRPAQLALLDGDTGRVRERVTLPAGPRHVAASDGGFLVPAEDADRLVAVRARDGHVTANVAVGAHPHAVAVAGATAFVADEQGNGITVVRSGRAVGRFAVATQPGGVAVVRGGRALAVVSVRERVLELYSTTPPYRRLARASAGVGPTHVVAEGALAWVVDTQGDALLVFRTDRGLRLVRRARLSPGPYGIALDAGRRRLWVTLTGSNELAELPAHGRPHVLRRFPVVRQPNGVAVDSRTGRVFVGGRADGVVELLAPPRQP